MEEYYTEEDCVVPLKEPINLDKLRDPDDEGQSFQLKELDNLNIDENLTSNAFFEPKDVLRNCYLPEDDSDADEDDDSTPFEKMARKMEDISPSGDNAVVKKILSQGSGNVVPKEALVQIHWNGFLEYGDEPFDSSRLRDMPLKRKLGKGEILTGLDIGISTMKKGELSRFIIKHDYAFGKMGCPPRIPPEATVMYEVELLSFVDHAGVDDYYFLSEEEKRKVNFDEIRKVYTAEKQEGKILFDNKLYGKAYQHYRKAATVLEDYHLKDSEEEKEQQQMLLKMYDHMAVCSSKLAKSGRCINYCKKMMEIEPTNIRALYFFGKSLHQMQEFDRAKDYLLRARKLDPNNRSINEEITKLERDLAKFRVMEADMYSKMFSKPKGQTEKEKELESKKLQQKEDKCLSCSEDFQKIVKDKLNEFKADDSSREMPFPLGNLSIGEIECILATALDLGLDAREVGSGQNYRMKIVKK